MKSILKQMFAASVSIVTLLASCSKDDPKSPELPQENPFILNVEYDDRAYNPGEIVDISLTVEEQAAEDDYFLFAPVFYGTGKITLEGEEIFSRKGKEVDYEIINASKSSKILHFTVAPEFSDHIKKEYYFRFFVSRPDGTYKTYKQIKIKTQNVSPITSQIISTGESHIMADETYSFEWSASKEGYTGNFNVAAEVIEGDGKFLDPDKDNHVGNYLSMQANSTRRIEYQPLKAGIHKFTITISDSVCETVLEGSVEVIPTIDGPESGLLNPDPGVYIYGNLRYYTREKWKKEWGIKAEGVAIISAKNNFLLAPKYFSGKWAYPPKNDNTDRADYMSIMPELTWTMDLSIAKADFNGYKNTKALIDADSKGLIQAPVAKLCYNYDPEEPGKWYIPAAGQLYMIHENFKEVQACLKTIDGQCFNYQYGNEYYCSSTGCNSRYIFTLQCHSSGTSAFGNHWIYPTHEYKSYPVRDL